MADTLEIRRDLTCSGGSSSDLPLEETRFRTPGPVADDAFEIVLFSYSIVPVTARNNNSFPSGTNGPTVRILFAPALSLRTIGSVQGFQL